IPDAAWDNPRYWHAGAPPVHPLLRLRRGPLARTGGCPPTSRGCIRRAALSHHRRDGGRLSLSHSPKPRRRSVKLRRLFITLIRTVRNVYNSPEIGIIPTVGVPRLGRFCPPSSTRVRRYNANPCCLMFICF